VRKLEVRLCEGRFNEGVILSEPARLKRQPIMRLAREGPWFLCGEPSSALQISYPPMRGLAMRNQPQQAPFKRKVMAAPMTIPAANIFIARRRAQIASGMR
jgi:hypothetical protein